MVGVFYFIICPEFRRTYIAIVLKILFFPIALKLFSTRFGPLGVRKCNKKFRVCRLLSVCPVCNANIRQSFQPIHLKFGMHMYLGGLQVIQQTVFQNFNFFKFYRVFSVFGLRINGVDIENYGNPHLLAKVTTQFVSNFACVFR